MTREIEVKVLGIDSSAMESRLQELGAERGGCELQRIYTYDFLPFDVTVPGILRSLAGTLDERKKEPLRRHLTVLLADLEDIVGGEESLAGVAEAVARRQDESALEQVAPRVTDLATRVKINPNKWVRLRESGGRTTIGVKQILGRSGVGGDRRHDLDSVREVDVAVGGFEEGRRLLEALGFFPKNYQEKRRTSYRLWGRIEVDIDEWPGIPAYLEIEGPSEHEVLRAAAVLGFSRDELRGMNADDVFAFYGKDMYEKPELRF